VPLTSVRAAAISEATVRASNPPSAPMSIFPFTSRGSSIVLVRSCSADRLAAAQKVATQVPTIHPLPVILPRKACPLDDRRTESPSDIQSVSPVSTTMQRSLRANCRTTLAGSVKPGPTLSTPRDRTSADSASAPISPALPFITLGCHSFRSSGIAGIKFPGNIHTKIYRTIRNVPPMLSVTDGNRVEDHFNISSNLIPHRDRKTADQASD